MRIGAPNERPSIGFVRDTLADGRALRARPLVDHSTREPTPHRGGQGAGVSESCAARVGAPPWRAAPVHRPEKPAENAYIESVNGCLPDECLNQRCCLSLADARRTIERSRHRDNAARPYGLAGRTRLEFVEQIPKSHSRTTHHPTGSEELDLIRGKGQGCPLHAKESRIEARRWQEIEVRCPANSAAGGKDGTHDKDPSWDERAQRSSNTGIALAARRRGSTSCVEETREESYGRQPRTFAQHWKAAEASAAQSKQDCCAQAARPTGIALEARRGGSTSGVEQTREEGYGRQPRTFAQRWKTAEASAPQSKQACCAQAARPTGG